MGGGAPSVLTYWQLLTLPFRGAFAAAGSNVAALAPLLLYAGCAQWTFVYDTIYAHQDRRDDSRLRLGSAAAWIGVDRSRFVLGVVAAGGVSAWAAAGVCAGLAWPWMVAVATAATHLLWQVSSARWDDGGNLTRRFVSNQTVGSILFIGAVAGRCKQKQTDE